MRDNGFGDIESADITLEVMQRIHPGIDESAIQRDGVRTYLHGVLRPANANDTRDAIEVYCLFDAADELLGLIVGPLVVIDGAQKTSSLRDGGASRNDFLSRVAPSPSRLCTPPNCGPLLLACITGNGHGPRRISIMVS
jgi:hypothetical protein